MGVGRARRARRVQLDKVVSLVAFGCCATKSDGDGPCSSTGCCDNPTARGKKESVAREDRQNVRAFRAAGRARLAGERPGSLPRRERQDRLGGADNLAATTGDNTLFMVQ